MLTTIQRRDLLLESLRAEFATKVVTVLLTSGRSAVGPALDAFLRDLANNLAQGLVEVCSTCGGDGHLDNSGPDYVPGPSVQRCDDCNGTGESP